MKKYLHIVLLFVTIQVKAQIGIIDPGTGVLMGLGVDSTLGIQNLAAGNSCISYCSLISLPLHLLDFWGSKEATDNHLYWKTTNEVNVKYYIIQRSADQQFDSIGAVTSLNISGNYQYDFIDRFPLVGKNFYRLKMTDIDGRFTYSKTILLNRPVTGKLSVYPNPATGHFTVELYSLLPGGYQLDIIDMNGKSISAFQKTAAKGLNNWSFTAERFSSGKYVVIVLNKQTGERMYTSVVIIK